MNLSYGKPLRNLSLLFFLILIIFILGISRNCSSPSQLNNEGNSRGDTLDIAIIFGPNSLFFDGDTLSGINKTIALKFAEDQNIPVKIWPVANLHIAMENLENHSFDILASLPPDSIVKSKFLTSPSIFLDRLVLIQRKDSNQRFPINSSLDLNGKKIFIPSNSSAYQRLKNIANEIGGKIDIEILDNYSEELICLKVINGDIPYAVVNEKTAIALSKNYPSLSYDNPISFNQFQVWLFNSQDSLLADRFKNWFLSFKESQEYQDIQNSL